MKLVDSDEEQDLLEDMLESSKPPLPSSPKGLDYLLATPFRYPPHPGGSRFRGPVDPGVFYGADTVKTACAELGYWRWKFLRDAVDLDRIEPVPHTAFKSRLDTQAVDLRTAPFNRDAKLWTSPNDYSATQAFGRIARESGVGAIIYKSIRNPEPAWCIAVLTPSAFKQKKPDPIKQTWHLAVFSDHIVWRRDENESFAFKY